MGSSFMRRLMRLPYASGSSFCHTSDSSSNSRMVRSAAVAAAALVLTTQQRWVSLRFDAGGKSYGRRKLPSGMSLFPDTITTSTEVSPAVAGTDRADVNVSSSSSFHSLPFSTMADPLPPWPVDAIEFNARKLPDGGHAERLTHERSLQEGEDTGRGDDEGGFSLAGSDENASVLSSVSTPPTKEQLEALKAAETTVEGRKALRVGGWVCHSCLHVMPHRARSVCDVCHTLRYDAATTVKSWRADRFNWLCAKCMEFNYERDTACRCCGAAREGGNELRAVSHERVADEVANASLGAVVNVRNRVCRWRCTECHEVNSLQAGVCKSCMAERFSVDVGCPQCNAINPLNNVLVYDGATEAALGKQRSGDTARDTNVEVLKGLLPPPPLSRRSNHVFGNHNCFPPHAPDLICTCCHSPLHGGTVNSNSWHPWLCACGMANPTMRQSCVRCRLPRIITNPTVLLALLGGNGKTRAGQRNASTTSATAASSTASPTREWDMRYCTNWLCESCDGVNRASRYVVSVRQAHSAAAGGSDGRGTVCVMRDGHGSSVRKFAMMVHGDPRCVHCGAPWHHQLLQGGAKWRCACHYINTTATDLSCVACGLPALDELREDLLSMWTRGDWYCVRCHKQNYRERQKCLCGADRPSANTIIDNAMLTT